MYFYSLARFAQLSDKSKNANDALFVFCKYYLIEAICSSLPAAVCLDLNSLGAWLGIFNFLYQVLVLYDPDLNIMKILLYDLCKVNKPILNNDQLKAAQVISMSGTQILSILYLNLAIWYWKNKCLYKFLLVSKCDFSIEVYVDLKIENILVGQPI